ncbi:MAG: hypothetical protein GX558_07865 [Clostridiales bacterium]|nr:hypothetical protein [Clostridiales bacterium]
MKYALSKGSQVLVPPGDFEHFNFMLDHIDQAIDHPLTGDERALLAREADAARDHLIFDTAQM